MKTLLLIAIFSLTDVCFAAAGDIDDFFVSFLKGEQTVFESNKKVSRREIQRMRVEIWTAWRKAVNENEEFKLAKMDKDTVVSAGKWKLPPELENNAVMNFTLFNKGKKPLTGYPLFLYLHGSGPKEKEYARGWNSQKASTTRRRFISYRKYRTKEAITAGGSAPRFTHGKDSCAWPWCRETITPTKSIS